jgi:protease YdgD
MLKYLRVTLCFLSMMLFAGLASAQERHPGVIGEDNRKIVESRDAPWPAIGQVNVSAYRFQLRCTGSLVAPDLVLTAAHCLIDPFTKKPFPLHQIHFLAGVRGSEWLAHSQRADVRHPPSGRASCDDRLNGEDVW